MENEKAEPVGNPPVNRTPEVLSNLFWTAVLFLQNYGWYLVFGVIAIYYVKKRLQPTITRWQGALNQQVNLHRYDDDRVLQRQQALEESRRRMQENFNAQAARFAEEQQQKEEEKRRQAVADWDGHLQGRGYKSKYKSPDESGGVRQPSTSSSTASHSKRVYRSDDYNPLAGGGGGGSCYRPDRRSGARGGGGG